MKLIKDGNVTKLPRATGTVKNMLARSDTKAREQGWTKIVIIGEGPKSGCTLNSKMKRTTLLGLLVDALHVCLHDE